MIIIFSQMQALSLAMLNNEIVVGIAFLSYGGNHRTYLSFSRISLLSDNNGLLSRNGIFLKGRKAIRLVTVSNRHLVYE